MPTRRRIAVITPDVLAGQMAGPAIRAVNIAEQLSLDHDVTLISTLRCEISRPGYRCLFAGWDELRAAVADAEIVVLQGFVSFHASWLLRTDKILVMDLYDPIHLEQLEQLSGQPLVQRRATADLTTQVLNAQLVRGDFFLCASEVQRNLWLGQLAAVGRLNPDNYLADPSLRSLIAICPFGVDPQPPARSGPGIRSVVDGIGPQDKVLLWAGGVYNWFDPVTLIRAVDLVRAEHEDFRLFFLGMKHPNPNVPAMKAAWDTRQLSESLGLTGKHVFFNEGWVPYDERANYLLDADAGVSTHLSHLETIFSFRTRILDYFWAGLPIVSTGGDSLGDLVGANGLGVTVAEGDVAGLAEAITRVLYDEDFARACRVAVERERERFAWPTALAPLVDFCADAHRAADSSIDPRRMARHLLPPRNPAEADLRRFSALVREGGISLLGKRIVSRTRRVAGRLSKARRTGGESA
ncbi:glycosyltransferase family 4 protein [Jatrophihabitans telluris]|uniref:Glycosyltransferase family 4 protein n=1 Tax=Jatrophihabitans telluris TaxID=2038343 RepID=A0ABY4QVF2_9ACTN|nr:glycosyltransferase family 4 protein [Jatrophihabitans telluris]UQX87560.1 glycosyltransferase family 4 protein [Jatrophihabitans telluris]